MKCNHKNIGHTDFSGKQKFIYCHLEKGHKEEYHEGFISVIGKRISKIEGYDGWEFFEKDGAYYLVDEELAHWTDVEGE